MKKKKTEQIGVIRGKDLMKNSANKLGRHDAIVKTGTGAHTNKNRYNRKGKNNQQLKNQLRNYDSGVADFNLVYFLL